MLLPRGMLGLLNQNGDVLFDTSRPGIQEFDRSHIRRKDQ